MRTLIFMLAVAAGSVAAKEPQLIGHWDFDGVKEGTVPDRSPRGRHGRIHGAPERVTGIRGEGLRFKTNDDYVDFGAPIIPARDFSISIWVNCDDVEKQFFLGQYRYAHPNRLDLAVREGAVRIQVDAIIDSAKVIQPRRWYHLAYTRANGVLTTYVDGVRVTSGPLPADVLQEENLMLGKIVVPKQDSFRFTGVIDDVGIWDGALSENAVRELARGRGK